MQDPNGESDGNLEVNVSDYFSKNITMKIKIPISLCYYKSFSSKFCNKWMKFLSPRGSVQDPSGVCQWLRELPKIISWKMQCPLGALRKLYPRGKSKSYHVGTLSEAAMIGIYGRVFRWDIRKNVKGCPFNRDLPESFG